jgi:galactokinase/galacturonokinase
VRQGVKAWQRGDIEGFGKLIFESCESSIHNYECGSPELIALYEIMRNTDGIYGGRFSGAGFKGACIALVDPEKEEAVRENVSRKYLERFPQYRESFRAFFCEPDNGVRLVDVSSEK